jgi:hypothetical protein
VRAAVEAGAAKVSAKGLLVNKVVIANPRPEVMRDLIWDFCWLDVLCCCGCRLQCDTIHIGYKQAGHGVGP